MEAWKSNEQVTSTLKEFVAHHPKGLEDLAPQVKHFKVCKCFDKQTKRIEWTCVPGTPACTLMEYIWPFVLQIKGASALAPFPPPGDLERTLQQWLDNRSA